MGIRRQARELAMQALFCMDMGDAFSMDMLEDYQRIFPPGKRILPYFKRLVMGVLENRRDIDTRIEQYSNNWKVPRMACVDRNVLRLAVWELLYCEDIPAKVSINEAIDIGKKFGSTESGAFINGILDSIHLALQKGQLRPVTTPAPI
jgi:N utilization substance protein B